MVRFRSFGAKKSFLKNAWDGCGKPDKLRMYNSLHVPNTLGTSLGQAWDKAGTRGTKPRICNTSPFVPVRRTVGQRDKPGQPGTLPGTHDIRAKDPKRYKCSAISLKHPRSRLHICHGEHDRRRYHLNLRHLN